MYVTCVYIYIYIGILRTLYKGTHAHAQEALVLGRAHCAKVLQPCEPWSSGSLKPRSPLPRIMPSGGVLTIVHMLYSSSSCVYPQYPVGGSFLKHCQEVWKPCIAAGRIAQMEHLRMRLQCIADTSWQILDRLSLGVSQQLLLFGSFRKSGAPSMDPKEQDPSNKDPKVGP